MLEVELDIMVGAQAAVFEHITDILNYETIVTKARAVAEEGHFILVEGLAERLGQSCMEDPRVLVARVRIDKPEALAPHAEAAGAEIVLVRP